MNGLDLDKSNLQQELIKSIPDFIKATNPIWNIADYPQSDISHLELREYAGKIRTMFEALGFDQIPHVSISEGNNLKATDIYSVAAALEAKLVPFGISKLNKLWLQFVDEGNILDMTPYVDLARNVYKIHLPNLDQQPRLKLFAHLIGKLRGLTDEKLSEYNLGSWKMLRYLEQSSADFTTSHNLPGFVFYTHNYPQDLSRGKDEPLLVLKDRLRLLNTFLDGFDPGTENWDIPRYSIKVTSIDGEPVSPLIYVTEGNGADKNFSSSLKTEFRPDLNHSLRDSTHSQLAAINILTS